MTHEELEHLEREALADFLGQVFAEVDADLASIVASAATSSGGAGLQNLSPVVSSATSSGGAGLQNPFAAAGVSPLVLPDSPANVPCPFLFLVSEEGSGGEGFQ